MKSRLDVTIFGNGDMHVWKQCIYAELWQDYLSMRHRAEEYWKKGTKKGDFLARRYERAAFLSLQNFFACVLERWMVQIEAVQVSRGSLWEQCRVLLDRTCSPQTVAAYDFSCLHGQLEAAEHTSAVLEQLDWEQLAAMEKAMDDFLSLIEQNTSLRRFPKVNHSSSSVVERLGSLFRRH